MLARVISSFGIVFVLMVWVIMCASTVGLIGEWFQVQNLAQFLANSQAKYGGYTTIANTALSQWNHDKGDSLQITGVSVSAAGTPVVYGTTVTAEVRCDYKITAGTLDLIRVPIVGKGQAVSSYWPGLYSVTYTHPSY